MKKRLLFTLIVSICLMSLFGCSDHKNTDRSGDVAKSGKKNSIARTVVVETIYDGETNAGKTEYEYNETGDLIKKTYYDESGEISQWQTYEYEYEYDKDGKVVSKRQYEYSNGDKHDANGKYYYYDKAGNIIKTENYEYNDKREDYDLTITAVYEYDDQNNRISYTDMEDDSVFHCFEYTYNTKNQLLTEESINYEMSIEGYRSTTEYTYDQNGDLNGYKVEDEDGIRIYKIVIEKDKDGNIIKYTRTGNDDENMAFSFQYENGNIIGIVSDGRQETFEYNNISMNEINELEDLIEPFLIKMCNLKK